jgi:cyclophilin family peptidyl-prolyl cis-trans isomerase/HEAT repeat protein
MEDQFGRDHEGANSSSRGASRRVRTGERRATAAATISPMPRSRLVRLASVAPCFAALSACASAPPRQAAPKTAAAADPAFLEERALLLLLEDRRLLETGALQAFLAREAPVREMLATALGRIGDRGGLPMLGVLAGDAEAPVRRAAAFAIGEIGDPASATVLLRAAADPDRDTGALAVEALGKCGASLADVSPKLSSLAAEERDARLLPSLFRFKEAAAVPLAQQGLASPDIKLHAAAAYALAREPRPEGREALRGLLSDPDPWVRGMAARGLGIVGEGADLARLRKLLDDAPPGPIIQALRAARRLVQAGSGAAPRDWLPRVRELISDERPGVSLTAIEASASWLPDPSLGDALARLATEGPLRARELALLALAEVKDSRAAQAVALAARAGDPVLRARAAEAAGRLADAETLTMLGADPQPAVRNAVLGARLEGADAESAAREALEDADTIVRATALDFLAEHPSMPLESIEATLAATDADALPDALLAAARAIAARGKAEPLERGRAVEDLEKLAAHSDFLVRREAAARLADLGRPAPPAGAANNRDLAVYRDIVRETSTAKQVEIDTRRGRVRLRLDCPTAPLTCLNFVQLARQGFFDGLSFHRVVPDFVVQGGDPRGDGAGGPGFAIRDEINRIRYDRGVVGMALSGPDTGGSQFFITLSPQPHLDGGYTAFGAVVEGDAVLDQLMQGDRIVAARVLP